ncbi:MAG: GTPase HflX [Treponema sp.]|nr:GTPase HflX [Spirochaetia bacterium]MDY2840670.1 GTPase HflX [Treponema sp.]MDY5123394.1 GTPase HflX [Treponema sp.]
MVEVEKEANKVPRALLVGEPGNDLQELKGLVLTLGMDVIQRLTLNRMEIHPAYGMGTGKAKEISELAHQIEADCIIFDFNIEPRKQRNWEELTNLSCFDRQEVIIRIFAQRAQTKEAVLQVDLARLQYSLPRLSHMNKEYSRQRGGAFGTKGSGETQLELDQRQIRDKIASIKHELAEVELNRQVQRKQRGKIPSCALVGYTNAGKSSLLNTLTGSEAFVENKLFATLDPLTRKMSLNDSAGVLITDTVGFISNLPHHLIDAFKSTLEEATYADLLLIVLDSSDPNAEFHYKTVCAVLEEIGAADNPRLLLLNKVDKAKENDELLTTLRHKFPEAICVSAKEEMGLVELKDNIYELLYGDIADYVIPVTQSVLINELRKAGCIQTEEWLDDGVHITARATGRLLALISPYEVDTDEA